MGVEEISFGEMEAADRCRMGKVKLICFIQQGTLRESAFPICSKRQF